MRFHVLALIALTLAACATPPLNAPSISVPETPAAAEELSPEAASIKRLHDSQIQTIESWLARFESSTGKSKYSTGHTLLWRSIPYILEAKGRWFESDDLSEDLMSPEPPRYGEYPFGTGGPMMTMHIGYRVYFFNRREFPEYAVCNDANWPASYASLPAEMPDDLAVQIRARANQAITLLRGGSDSAPVIRVKDRK